MKKIDGKRSYEHWCEINRVAPPLVLSWDELSDEQKKPFLEDNK